MSDGKLARVSDVMKIAHELALDGMGKLDVHALEGRLYYLPAADAREAARVLLAHPAALSAIVDAMLRGANVAEPTREDAATVSQCLREALMLIGEARP